MNKKRANRVKGNQTIYQIKEVNKRLREEVLALERITDSKIKTYDDKYNEAVLEYYLRCFERNIKEN